MGELRRDPINGRWVIIETESPWGPDRFEKEQYNFKGNNCPFCLGNEKATPPEIDSIRDPNTKPDAPGWQVRVVPNKFPALMIEGLLDRRGIGVYDMSNGVGAHEVILDSPYHEKSIADLSEKEITLVIHMYCRRALDLIKDDRFRYILFFKNHGASAGASLEHDHTQLIALSMVPKNVLEELHGAKDYYHFRQRCIFCDMIYQEYQDKVRVIQETRHFIAFCPFASRFPFEVWILPKAHNPYFCHISEEEKADLAKILKDLLSRLKTVLFNPAYNYIIHSSPLDEENKNSYHWHIEIMPKLTRIAGFEWGTGFYIVPTPPEIAVRYLKEVTF